MDTNIDVINIETFDDCIEISIRYKNGQSLGGAYNRASTIGDLLKLKYGVIATEMVQYGSYWVSVHIPKTQVQAAVAFKLEFG